MNKSDKIMRNSLQRKGLYYNSSAFFGDFCQYQEEKEGFTSITCVK